MVRKINKKKTDTHTFVIIQIEHRNNNMFSRHVSKFKMKEVEWDIIRKRWRKPEEEHPIYVWGNN